MTKVHDTIFVGAGIACLYKAFRYKHENPHATFLVLEKSGRAGGRVAWATFAGVEVTRGAGVGRFHNAADQLLLALVTELGVPFEVRAAPVRHHGPGTDPGVVPDALRRLRGVMTTEGQGGRQTRRGGGGETFKEFGTRVLGERRYESFVVNTGYGDYEAMDSRVALEHYHFEDVHGVQTNFLFSWHALVRALVRNLSPHVRLDTDVQRLSRSSGGGDGCGWVVAAQTRSYRAKQVCVGVTVESLRKLFPTVAVYGPASIQSQPFMRIYALLNKRLPAVLGFTVVGGVLQKVLPTPKDRVYMIAYADNSNALALRDYTRAQLQAELRTVFGDPDVRILRSVKFFWHEGTHFYPPSAVLLGDGSVPAAMTDGAQHPAKGVYVVGEAVALNQGWVGPALLSTTRVNL